MRHIRKRLRFFLQSVAGCARLYTVKPKVHRKILATGLTAPRDGKNGFRKRQIRLPFTFSPGVSVRVRLLSAPGFPLGRVADRKMRRAEGMFGTSDGIMRPPVTELGTGHSQERGSINCSKQTLAGSNPASTTHSHDRSSA